MLQIAEQAFGPVIGFFIYDTVKIIGFLFLMIAVIGFLRSFLPQARIKALVSGRGAWANFFASLLGAVTPFCSCSSIPLCFSFFKAGVPVGVAFSFLITSPLINEYLVVLMLGLFGWKITLAYIVSGMAIGIICGLLLGRMGLEKYLERDIFGAASMDSAEPQFNGMLSRVRYGFNEAVDIVKKLWVWILFGVGLGAAIHNYVPQEAVQTVTGSTGIFSVPIATLIGVPMYGSCAAIVPIALALFEKGFPLGTALSFMMAVAALSLPEAVMLRRAMKLQLILIFFGITAAGIIVTGYLFNVLQHILI